MKRIALIESNYLAGFLTASNEFGLGVLLLATELKKANYKFEIISASIDFKEKTFEELTNYILDQVINNYDLVCFSTRCDSYPFTLDLAARIKRIDKNITVILGGPQATLCAEETLNTFEFIDYIVRGEGEITFLKLMEALVYEKDVSLIEGISFKNNNTVVHNADRELIKHICSRPDYNLLPRECFNKLGKSAFVQVEIGRGCPGRCTYCCTKKMWSNIYRLVDIDNFCNNIIELNQKYKFTVFNFAHDNFFANTKEAIIFLQSIKKINKNKLFSWTCSTRIEFINEEILKLLVESGCSTLFIGIESGSAQMQNTYKKYLKLKNIKSKINLINKYKIGIIASFVFGHPEETIIDFEKTLELCAYIARNFKKNEVQIHKLVAHNGTELFDQYNKTMYYDGLFSDQSENDYINNTHIEIIKKNKLIFPSFYSLPIKDEIKMYVKYLNRICILINMIPNTILKIKSQINIDIIDFILDLSCNYEIPKIPDIKKIFKEYDIVFNNETTDAYIKDLKNLYLVSE